MSFFFRICVNQQGLLRGSLKIPLLLKQTEECPDKSLHQSRASSRLVNLNVPVNSEQEALDKPIGYSLGIGANHRTLPNRLITACLFVFFALLFVFPTVNHVADSQNGVATQHFRAGVSHNVANAISHLGFIAMDVALGARPLG